MKRVLYLFAILLTLGFAGFATASSPATPAVDATPSFLQAPTTPCEEARSLSDGTECCSDDLLPSGCSGACYVEIYCPDGRYLGCYGSNSSACSVEGEYVRCDANYYSCDQCKADYPFALGCEYC